MTTDTRNEFIGGLRAFADALEANPEIPLPTYQSFSAEVLSAEELAAAARALPGRVRKEQLGSQFTVEARFNGIPYTISAGGVCRKVVTGTKMVRRPVRKRTGEYREVEVPVIEYQCPPSLLNGAGGGE